MTEKRSSQLSIILIDRGPANARSCCEAHGDSIVRRRACCTYDELEHSDTTTIDTTTAKQSCWRIWDGSFVATVVVSGGPHSRWAAEHALVNRSSYARKTAASHRIASDGIASRIHTADIVDCIVAVSATPKLELEKILTIDNLVSFLTTLESSESESLLQHLPEEHETLFDEVRSLRIHQRGSETTTYSLTYRHRSIAHSFSKRWSRSEQRCEEDRFARSLCILG